MADRKASCSVVIPCLNEKSSLALIKKNIVLLNTLNAEIIIVDGGSSDGSEIALADLADYFLETSKGRALQMNAGATVATAEHLVFLHADSELNNKLIASLNSALQQKPIWGFCLLQLSGQELWAKVISFFINLRSSITSVATGDQMLFVSKETFMAIKGFPEIALMEDVALSKKLRTTGKPIIIKEKLITSSRRWRHRGVVRTVLTMWLLRFLYLLGVSPTKLQKIYYA